MKSQQLKNLTGIVSENQISENYYTSLWLDSVQQWFFCIPSSKFVNLTKFTTGTRNGIYLSRNISPFECGWNDDILTNISPLISECPNCFIHQQFVVYNQRHQNKFTVTRKQRERGKWLLVSFLMQCLINLSTPSPKNFKLHVTTLHSQIVCISFCINLHKYFSSSVENI